MYEQEREAKKVNLIAALDWSMTCPAITVFLANKTFCFENVNCYFASEKKVKHVLPNLHGTTLGSYSCDEERFDNLAEWAVNVIHGEMRIAHDNNLLPIPVVYMEDYSYASSGKVFHIAECAGQVKHRLWKNGIPVNKVPPTVVKKHATQKGNADKNGMHDAFAKQTGVNLQALYSPKASKVSSPVGDVVDSYYICSYGTQSLGEFV